MEYSWQVYPSSEVEDEGLKILERIGCLRIYRHETIPTFVKLDWRKFFEKFDPLRTKSPTITGRLRSQYPVLASFVDFDQEWIEAAMGSWRQELSAADSTNPDLSDVVGQLDVIERNLGSEIYIDPSSNEMTAVSADIDRALEAIRSSNTMGEEARTGYLRHISQGRGLIAKAGNISVGAIKFLLIDRLKAAYEEAAEDSLKLIIQAAFMAIILTVIGKL